MTARSRSSAFLFAVLAAIAAIAVVIPFGTTRVDRARTNTGTTSSARSEKEPAAGTPVEALMRNVDYHASPWVVMNIRMLRGELRSKRPGRPPVFEDKESFVLQIHEAEIGMTQESLSGLLNKHVFAYPGSPLANLEVRIEPDRIAQKGSLRKALGMRFSIVGTLSVTPEGELRVHPTSVGVAGVGVRGLMKGLGLRLDKLLTLDPERGVRAEGNDLLLRADRMLPPPEIHGRVTQARLERGRMVLVFETPGGKPDRKLSPPDASAPNFMYYEGGTLAFGRLTMKGTKLQIVDDDPSDPFDFFVDHYNEQLVAGYDKNLPDGGLIVHMPDYKRLGESADSPGRPAPLR